MTRCAGAILAGGGGTRLGAALKGLLEVGGERIVDRFARALAGAADDLLLVASARVCELARPVEWNRSYCPCCGGSPDFSVRDDTVDGGLERDRGLVCARCDTTWRTEALGCLGCGERESPTIARISSDALGYQLAICNACGRYLKEPAAPAPLDPLVERVLTAQLDAAAEARGLRL